MLKRIVVVSFVACALLAGCATDAPTGAPTDRPLPATSGAFRGAYSVPVPDELAAAATFTIDHLDWTVLDGVATLHYDLPVGLVGGDVRIDLSGPIEPGATIVTLTGAVGTGTCTSDGRFLSCVEQFTGLGALPISAALVEQTARAEYAGPASDRLAVAELFGGPDPIGIATLDLQAPVAED
ncbi:MAG: hypothetical protein IPL61_24295 [Myxococcales bacterium]|nr:hypothetical protein [Myxococcales bacterium]